jgi:hypothetical protein
MFRDFVKKKFDDYLALLEFPAGRISFSQIRNSSLPPFIISFLEYYIPSHNISLDKKDFEQVLHKAIVFNINYIIKPKNTILKFLFGDVETRPAHFIRNRLRYFQFYGYYVMQIEDFIDVNSVEVVTYNQIEHLINEVNKKIYEEITAPGNNSHRMNLVKLLYYFFHDLGDNNPINIKLPKKILSVYFYDKSYPDIKKRIDSFFSDEIFIQEAIELMDPKTRKSARELTDVGVSDAELRDIITKAKTQLINNRAANEEVEKILLPEEVMPEEPLRVNIEVIREQESKLPEIEKNRLIISEDLYSDDLIFAAQFNDITPPAQLTDKEKRDRLLDDLFCESTYKKRIIKYVFNKDESNFMGSVNLILDLDSWDIAAEKIESIFNKNKVDYYSEEAVKFVDIMQSHFAKDSNSNKHAGSKAV